MIRRAFSKLSELIEISSKAKLPDLNPNDRERTIKDISSYFDIMMETALPNKNINERPMLSQKDLNKMILLSSSEKDCDVLVKAYWTYCGHKLWPSNATLSLISQACVNLNAPEKAADFFLYHRQLRYKPRLDVFNRFLAGLMEKEQWKMIIEVFKIAQPSLHIQKNEKSYLIALYACKQLKKWKWCYRFLTRGDTQAFSESFHQTLAKLSQDLTEEEAKKFLAKPL